MNMEKYEMQTLSFFNRLCLADICFVHNYLAFPENYPMHNTGRRHHGFLYTLQGTETYRFADKTIAAVPHSVLYIPKNEDYTITFSDKISEVRTIDFEMAAETEPARPFLVKLPENNPVAGLFAKLEAAYDKRAEKGFFGCKSVFYQILEHTAEAERLFLPSEKYAKIAKAVEQMRENFLNGDFRLETLSEECGISYRYFEQLFHRKYGMSPKEYLLSLRLEHAKKLLADSDMRIKDIALMLGYGDITHFGKLFTAKTGYTPREYRSKTH